MALREKIIENSRQFLDPGEQVQAAFPAQTASSLLVLVGYIPFILANKYRCVVATDRRILVLDAGHLSTTKPRSVIRALPRSTRIGPASGLFYRTDALGENLRIHKRFHGDIAAADGPAR